VAKWTRLQVGVKLAFFADGCWSGKTQSWVPQGKLPGPPRCPPVRWSGAATTESPGDPPGYWSTVGTLLGWCRDTESLCTAVEYRSCRVTPRYQGRRRPAMLAVLGPCVGGGKTPVGQGGRGAVVMKFGVCCWCLVGKNPQCVVTRGSSTSRATVKVVELPLLIAGGLPWIQYEGGTFWVAALPRAVFGPR